MRCGGFYNAAMPRWIDFRAPRSPTILRPRDQAAVAVLVLGGVLLIVACWSSAGGFGGRQCELTEQPRRPATFLLDINTASAAELDLLPNIGEARAQQIIRERARRPFASADDLALRIKGIGPKTIEGMRPYLLPMLGPTTESLASR